MAEEGRNTGSERICPTCHESFDKDVDFCPEDGARLIVVGQDAEDRVGQNIEGKYEIRALLGAGGMGGVYRAYQTSMDREVAIKLIHRSFSDDGTAVRRFLQEAKGASRLNHPNIITLFEFGQSGERELYLVMELLEGDTLEQVVRRNGPMDPKRVVAMASQICDALHHAHENQLVHRDLKPDNIMVLTGAGRHGEFIKVLDFGIAKVRAVEGAESLTRTGMVCGTPSYMSPEQARDQPLDRRSDIYSIGVVLYEMLSGALPFTGGTPIDMLMAHVSKAPKSLTDGFPELEVPPALDAVVMDCLAKDPLDRPPTADDLKGRLYEAMELESGVFHRAGTDQLPRAEKDNSDVALAATAAVVATNPTEAAPKPQAVAPSEATDIPTGMTGVDESTTIYADPPASRKGLWMAVAAVVLLGVMAWQGKVAIEAEVPEPQAAAEVEAPSPAAPAGQVPSEPSPTAQPSGSANPPSVPPLPATCPVLTEPPGATVLQGDKVLGKTPMELKRPEAGAPVTLEFSLEGYKTISVQVNALQQGEVKVTLSPEPKPPKQPEAKKAPKPETTAPAVRKARPTSPKASRPAKAKPRKKKKKRRPAIAPIE